MQQPMVRRMAGILVLFLVVWMSGCASSKGYQMSVNAITDGVSAYTGYTYIVLPHSGMKSSLETKEFLRQVQQTLHSAGIRTTDSLKQADAALVVGYVAGTKDQKVTYQKPVYGNTGSTSSTFGTSNKRSGTYASTKDTTTTYGIKGFKPATKNVTYYVITLGFNAFYLEDKRELWSAYISSMEESLNIRKRLPIMLSGVHDYLGKNTTGIVWLDINENEDGTFSIKEAQD